MPTIGKIRAELHGDTRQFERSMRRSSKQVSSLERQFMAFRGAILPLTGSIGFGALIRSTLEQTERLGQLAARLDISVETFSKLQRVLARSGVGMDQTGVILQRLQRRAADAESGNKKLGEAFAELGLNLNTFIQLDPVEAFLRTGEALARVDNTARRVKLAFQLLDSEGVQVLQADLSGLRDEMDRTVATTSDQVAAVERLAAQWARLGESISKVVLVVGNSTGIFDALTRKLDALATVFGGTGSVSDQLSALSQFTKFPITSAREGTIVPFLQNLFRPSAQEQAFQGAPLTGDIQGDRTITGGNLGPSNAILAELQGIRRNTEQTGAVLE